MKIFLNLLPALSILLAFPSAAQGQDLRIPLDQDFLDSAIEYKVKKKPMSSTIHKKKWKRKWNFFGPYVIHNWNKESSDQKNRRNFWGTKFESTEHKEWTYDVFAPGLDTLQVDVAYSFSSNEKGSIQISGDVPITFGQDELLSQKLNIAIMLQSVEEQADPWMLLLSMVEGSKEYPEFKGLFFKGDRKIEVLSVDAGTVMNFGYLAASSRGYVFKQGGHEIAAVQNSNANFWKPNERFVWLDSSLDQELQLNISAAISVILLLKDDINFLQASGG